ncbi:MAG: hypothetical protein LC667_03770 [Thioalkalivibrio sp.]|nr:hypothetical protein [Thioalkalivibrio sp.]
MIFDLFQREPLLDDTTRDWIHEIYAWAMRQQGREIFFASTQLVLPTPEFFPGRADSVHGMAQLVFDSVRGHAGLDHWPCRLQEPGIWVPQAYPHQTLAVPIRALHGSTMPAAQGSAALFSYTPELVANPEALIADFARELAHHLVAAASESPPAGEENRGHVTELVGVFMGFGIMFANTAFNVRVNSCGSCQGPVAERPGFLSRADLSYALALFCRLKDIPASQARPHLKSGLRAFFRRALRDIDRNPEVLATVRGDVPPLTDPALPRGYSKPF